MLFLDRNLLQAGRGELDIQSRMPVLFSESLFDQARPSARLPFPHPLRTTTHPIDAMAEMFCRRTQRFTNRREASRTQIHSELELQAFQARGDPAPTRPPVHATLPVQRWLVQDVRQSPRGWRHQPGTLLARLFTEWIPVGKGHIRVLSEHCHREVGAQARLLQDHYLWRYSRGHWAKASSGSQQMVLCVL